MNTQNTYIYTGIWLDGNKAIVVTVDRDKSHIVPVFSTKKKWPGLSHLKGSTAAQPLSQKIPIPYYSQICSQLYSFDNVLILGPDENKFHLKEYMEENVDKLGKLNTKVAGHMATGDIIKLVRKYFLRTQSLPTE